jgi:hypothetical protein
MNETVGVNLYEKFIKDMWAWLSSHVCLLGYVLNGLFLGFTQ